MDTFQVVMVEDWYFDEERLKKGLVAKNASGRHQFVCVEIPSLWPPQSRAEISPYTSSARRCFGERKITHRLSRLILPNKYIYSSRHTS